MQIGGQSGKGGLVLADMLHERRAPGLQRHRIDQDQPAIIPAVQQMAAQGRGPAEIMGAEIMGNDERRAQAPIFALSGVHDKNPLSSKKASVTNVDLHLIRRSRSWTNRLIGSP